MKTPTWGTVIGIMMIAFGGCSVLNNVQIINLPSKLEEQKAVVNQRIDDSTRVKSDSVALEPNDSLTQAKAEKLESPEKELELSEFAKTWMVRFGYMGILVAIIYILGGVFLLKPRRFSIKLAYGALILSIAYCAAQTIVLTSTGSSAGTIALIMGASKILSIVIDIILLSVIFASDHDAYEVGNVT